VDTVYIHFRGHLPPNGILSGRNFILGPSVAFFYIFSVTARHSSSGCQPNFAAFSRRRHIYSAGRPSRWALAHMAHILVILLYLVVFCTKVLCIIRKENRVSVVDDKSLPMFAQKSLATSYLVNNIRLLCLDYVDFYFLTETNVKIVIMWTKFV